MFSNEVKLNIFGPTEIVSQSKDVVGNKGGFVSMRVDVVTPGGTPDKPIEYQ